MWRKPKNSCEMDCSNICSESHNSLCCGTDGTRKITRQHLDMTLDKSRLAENSSGNLNKMEIWGRDFGINVTSESLWNTCIGREMTPICAASRVFCAASFSSRFPHGLPSIFFNATRFCPGGVTILGYDAVKTTYKRWLGWLIILL